MHERRHSPEPGTGYDAIIVGAGLHGLATAYYLAERHGMTDVAVLDQRAELNHVAWAFARGAAARGVDLIPECEVTGILTHRGRVAGVETTRGCIEAPRVALATGRHTSALADMVGLRTPLDGLFIDCGWSTGGLEAMPGAGRVYAETIATEEPHRLAEPFALERFASGALGDEHAAAAVAH